MEQSIIKVNTQTLADDSLSVADYIKDIQAQKQELQKSITTLNQMWSGDAFNVFVAAVSSDMQALQEVIDNLNKVYQYEQTAKTEYETCEKKVSKLIEEITIKEV